MFRIASTPKVLGFFGLSKIHFFLHLFFVRVPNNVWLAKYGNQSQTLYSRGITVDRR